jgi:nucleotidyltransferase/DNA polymerase involved in DNA repair
LDADVKELVMKGKERELKDLISIGPAMLRDFELLGIRSVVQLAEQDPKKMYAKLGRIAKQYQDICVLDTFEAAVAQAKNPQLPAEKCQWWWWSEKRKRKEKRKRLGTYTEDTESTEDAE